MFIFVALFFKKIVMKKIIYLLVISLVIIIVSCRKDKTTVINFVPVTPVLSTSMAGFGPNFGTPSGTAWNLPANIKVVGAILGGNPGKAPFSGVKTQSAWAVYESNSPKTDWVTQGLGEFVSLYMKLTNAGTSTATFVFPAGLVFCNSGNGDTTAVDTTQTGVIVVSDTVVVPVGDTVNLCLKTYCCNLSRHAPTFNSIYQPKVISNNNQMVNFITALKGKTTLANHESDIQSYIWQFTGGTPLTAADYATIASWQ